MTADELNQLTATALDTLADALDRGHSEALTALLRAMSRFHRYSLNNAWLIAAQRPGQAEQDEARQQRNVPYRDPRLLARCRLFETRFGHQPRRARHQQREGQDDQ